MQQKQNTEPYRIGLVGLGTIGTGVAKILLQKKSQLARAVGRPIELAAICDKDFNRERDIALPPGLLSGDLAKITNDPTIELVVELVGGTGFAKELVLTMLENGKNIVTANKALVANCGTEVFESARKNGKTIAFEAAVCGGIPILGVLQTTLQANCFRSIRAIVNGTSNFILSQMEEKGTSYSEAVKEAQRLGYAEADPTLDVDGTDAAQKLAILAQLGYGVNVDWKSIPKQGIEDVSAIDIHYAKELGYKIRLLAVAEKSESDSSEQSGLELHVSPTLVSENSSLADVSDAFNAVEILGDAVGPAFFHGYGAGQMPTASSVVGDIIDTILGRTAITFNALNFCSPQNETATLKAPSDISGKSYLRIMVEDRPGVLHEISGILGKHKISVASLIQHDSRRENNDVIPLIITTHESKEHEILQAIGEISKLACVKSKPIRMWVRD